MAIIEQIQTFIQQIKSNDVGYTEKLDALHKLQDDLLASPDYTFSDKEICKEFVSCLVFCVSSPTQTIRATGLRLSRLSCRNVEFLEMLIKANIGYFVAGALERSKLVTSERTDALKLIRHMIRMGPLIIPRSVVQPVIAIAQQEDDPLLAACLIVLCELTLHNPAIVSSCGGIYVILTAIVNTKPFYESFQNNLIVTIIYLLNDNSTRKYITPGEIELIIEPFTDTYEPSEDVRKAKWVASKNAISKFLSSWTGLICYAQNPLGLAAFVSSLCLPDLQLNHVVLDTLFTIFHMQVPKATDDPIQYSNSQFFDVKTKPSTHRHNLLQNYLAALLVAFNECNLIECLLKLCKKMNARLTTNEGEEAKGIVRKATCLIGEILHLSNSLLPPSQCANLQALPVLVTDAISFTLDPRLRSLAGTAITTLDKYSLMKRTQVNDSKLDYFEEIKKNMYWKMDEVTLKQKLNESVLLKKDSSTWDWDMIGEVIGGPLANPVHFQSPLAARYIKKILSYFKPSNKIFPNLPINDQTEQYSAIGRQLLELIVSHENALAIFTESQLLTEIGEVLKNEIDQKGPYFGLLSKEKVLQNMVKAYFEMLGVLSQSKIGIEILCKFAIFDWLTSLSQLQGRDDLSSVVIKTLKYDKAGPSRVLLAKSLNSKSRVVRFYATRQMQIIMRSHVSDFSEWGVRYLVQKLTDQDTKVATFALAILDECVDDTGCLDSLINKRALPTLAKLAKPGNDLLIRFLSRPSGFEYLSGTPFVREEMVSWRQEGYINYAKLVESSLAGAFAAPVWRESQNLVNVPVHLYGELAHTKEGCKLIEQSGDFDYYYSILLNENSSSLQKRGALWVMAHIGRVKNGFKELITKNDALKLIIHIAKNCTCLSVKGTCFYGLGLMSQTHGAKRELRNHGWEAKRDTLIAVPMTAAARNIFTVNQWSTVPSWPTESPVLTLEVFANERDELVHHFANLSNKLTFDKSLNAIKKLKANNPEIFQDAKVQHQIFLLLEKYAYKLPPRRFFYQIFAVHWSFDSLRQLPEAPIVRWKSVSEEPVAIFPEFTPSRSWIESRDRTARRSSVRGSVGLRNRSESSPRAPSEETSEFTDTSESSEEQRVGSDATESLTSSGNTHTAPDATNGVPRIPARDNRPPLIRIASNKSQINSSIVAQQLPSTPTATATPTPTAISSEDRAHATSPRKFPPSPGPVREGSNVTRRDPSPVTSGDHIGSGLVKPVTGLPKPPQRGRAMIPPRGQLRPAVAPRISRPGAPPSQPPPATQ